jgi:hypothetical protein
MKDESSRLPNSSSWSMRITNRLCRSIFTLPLAVAVLCGVTATFEIRRLGADESSPVVAASGEKPLEKQREGTTLTNVTGYFRLTGDRAMFYAETGARYGGLENLNLERVASAINDNPEQLQWSVSGTVTEYRGTNYLLVSRATLKAKPAASTTAGVKRTSLPTGVEPGARR